MGTPLSCWLKYSHNDVRIASFIYHYLSSVLIGNDTLISPVISSTIDCDTCNIQELQDRDVVSFKLQLKHLQFIVINVVYFKGFPAKP